MPLIDAKIAYSTISNLIHYMDVLKAEECFENGREEEETGFILKLHQFLKKAVDERNLIRSILG